MARILLASYMVRYPLGGVLSSSLQWLVGLQRLGHEVYFVEKSGWADSCFDSSRGVMTDDCTYGTHVLEDLLERFGLREHWCYVDARGRYHGLPRERVDELFRSADLFIDRGLTHGDWMAESESSAVTVLMDGDPGYCQMQMEQLLAEGKPVPDYDHYYTVGRNLGTASSTSPTAGQPWRPLFHPVVVDLFRDSGPANNGAFTTVMNWHAHRTLEYQGRVYGQKDMEFGKFMTLPRLTNIPLEIAVHGKDVPVQELLDHGWLIRDAHQVTSSFDSYGDYIATSCGEFGVCKNVFVATQCGWFSDRSAAYLASGRPVVLQETGFSNHLPCGEGLFAVRNAEEAAAAIEAIAGNYARHSHAARSLAREYLDASVVLGRFLTELGIRSHAPAGVPA